MGDVVDVRPDRFLRELREHGNVHRAAENAGLTIAEVEAMCRASIKFDRAQIECHLEYLEEAFKAEMHRRLQATRNAFYSALKVRHG
jgi:hypothetical protein